MPNYSAQKGAAYLPITRQHCSSSCKSIVFLHQSFLKSEAGCLQIGQIKSTGSSSCG